MSNTEGKTLGIHLSKLTQKQWTSLLECLCGPNREPFAAITEIERWMGDEPLCPHCGSSAVGKWGKADGLKRFRCQECRKTFNALTGTPLARLRKKEQWDQFAECIQDSLSVRASAKACGVHRNTTFRWRHRFLALMDENKPPPLHGSVEADNAHSLESARLPYRRGGKASKRGCSEEQP